VGRTPWSARVPLDPLFANEISLLLSGTRPTEESVAGEWVRTIAANLIASRAQRVHIDFSHNARSAQVRDADVTSKCFFRSRSGVGNSWPLFTT